MSFMDDSGIVPPTNEAAEWSVLSQMMTTPTKVPLVVAAAIEQRDFSSPDARLVYQTVIDRHFGSKSIDPLLVAETVREDLAAYWSADPSSVGRLLAQRVQASDLGSAIEEHAGVVKKLSMTRQVMNAALAAARECARAEDDPAEIADRLSTETLQATAGLKSRYELFDWMDTGRVFFRQLDKARKAAESGIEIGVHTGFRFLDSATSGIAPGELCFLAGDPGAGKTSVSFALMDGFAKRQMPKAPELRMGTLFLCLEMPLYQSAARWAQRVSSYSGSALRTGRVNDGDWRRLLQDWKNREGLPLYFNFASNMRMSQMRSLVAEAIRRYNVGFVVIDHFRMFDTDRRYTNPNQEDEAKVRFLKESLAQDLNVAVLCLAHTVKVGRDPDGKAPRPKLSDLRGSGQVAAHADFVGFLYRKPRASEEARELMSLGSMSAYEETAMEMYWEKNRFGSQKPIPLTFDPVTMYVADRTED